MKGVTQILSRLEAGESGAASELLPLVYEELRRLAESRMRNEQSGHTLQATALVHDAYLRLVDVEQAQHWDSRAHFFSCAAEAMRRILIESARRRQTLKRGGGRHKLQLDEHAVALDKDPAELLALNEAIDKLQSDDADTAEFARLRLFAGLRTEDAARILGISRTTGFRHWAYARAFLQAELQELAE